MFDAANKRLLWILSNEAKTIFLHPSIHGIPTDLILFVMTTSVLIARHCKPKKIKQTNKNGKGNIDLHKSILAFMGSIYNSCHIQFYSHFRCRWRECQSHAVFIYHLYYGWLLDVSNFAFTRCVSMSFRPVTKKIVKLKVIFKNQAIWAKLKNNIQLPEMVKNNYKS